MDRHRMRQRPVTVKNITFVQFLRRSKNRHNGAGECHGHSEVSSISFSPSFTDYFHSKAAKPRGCNQRQGNLKQGPKEKIHNKATKVAKILSTQYLLVYL